MKVEIKMCIDALRIGLKIGENIEDIYYLDTDIRVIDVLLNILRAIDEEERYSKIINELIS